MVLASDIPDPQTLMLTTRVNGQVVQHESTANMIFSVATSIAFLSSLMTLEPGDIFVGFTDGISEAMNRADEEWGEEQLIPAAAAHADKPACEIIPHLMSDADRFVDGAPQHDDMTLVVVKLQG